MCLLAYRPSWLVVFAFFQHFRDSVEKVTQISYQTNILCFFSVGEQVQYSKTRRPEIHTTRHNYYLLRGRITNERVLKESKKLRYWVLQWFVLYI